ncbi:GNAT family N-acetyltransferase [Sphingobacterium suaedae]|uniref:GNAT family N-acetyltransferase n=1 Tax=Sphingobacterium suaedae TaxID=1686402 RepID=A0ABW5KL19_9SPHI
MIKQANVADLEDIISLFEAYRTFYRHPSDLQGCRKFLTERLAHKESVIFIVYLEGKPVGFTQLYPKYSSARLAKNWILNDLFVDSDARNRGLGQQLIQTAVEFAQIDGATFVQLETQVENVIAQSLYKKMGFALQEPDTEFLVFKKQV